METVACGLGAEERESLFVVGLFSLLDCVLRVPLAEALRPLNLPPPVGDALLRQEGPYAPYLALAIACESSDPDRIATAAAACSTEPEQVNAHHFDALAWARAAQA
jgi:EAL and modified HD-GYP domain-containing signal transduction protein